jgi:uncharacterized membrane protein
VRMRNRRCFAVIAFGYIASIGVYSRLPGPYLIGDSRLLFARPMIAFLLPTTAALMYWLLRSLWLRDPFRDREETLETTYDAILLRIILFVIILHLIVLAGMTGILGGRMFAPRMVVMLLGLLLVGVGNLLPRTRPNIVIGFRTSRLMTDRSLWIRTHRVAGHVTVAVGIVIVVAGVLLSKSTIPRVIGTAALIGVGLIVDSYRRYAASEPERR